MQDNFFKRLKEYYLNVAEVLRGESELASIFPNSSDVGLSRERIYAEFLKLHAPSKCNVFLGGFLFDDEGKESGQLDIIITTDTAPRFNLLNKNNGGKSFSPVEGTLGVVSIKSMLDKNQLEDVLQNIASIPLTKSLERRISITLTLKNYEDWPYKIIYATNGLKGETILNHINTFYEKNPDIPIYRRPNIIHVLGKYVIIRTSPGTDINFLIPKNGVYKCKDFYLFTNKSDIIAISWVLDALQTIASASTHIIFQYGKIIRKLNLLP